MRIEQFNLEILLMGAGLLFLFPSYGFSNESDFDFFNEEVQVVTASKYKEPLSQAPGNVYVVTARDIEIYGYRTLGEALQSVPGMYTINDRNYSYLWVRGFGRPSDYNNRILCLINGHRINENIYGSVLLGHEFSLDVNDIDRIEVVKGPAASLYGDNAFFAVVNIITKEAQKNPQAVLLTEGGSYKTGKAYASVSGTSKNDTKGFLSSSYRQSHGARLFYPEFSSVNNGIAENSDGEENYTAYTQFGQKSWKIQANASHRRKQLSTGSYGVRFNDDGTYTVDNRGFVELQTNQKLSSSVEFFERIYYDGYQYKADYITDNIAPPPDEIINKDDAKSQWYGEEFRVQFSPLGANYPLTLGHEYERTLQGYQLNYDEDPYVEYFKSNEEEHRWAVFLQQTLAFTQIKTRFNLGLRYDRYSSFGKALNPRFSCLHDVSSKDQFKLMFGTAFRAPNVFERFYETPTYVQAQNLRPEEIRTWEFSWRRQNSVEWETRLSVFDNRVFDLIDQTIDPSGLIQIANTGDIKTVGMELENRWNFWNNFNMRLGYTLQETKKLHGDRLTNSPLHSGVINFNKHFVPSRTDIGIEVFALSRRKTLQNTTLASAAVLNTKITSIPWKNGIKIFGTVYNLLNKKYSIPAGAEFVQDAILQDGRHFLAGVEYNFGVKK